MAPRIDFVYLTHLFDEFERLADWEALIERATLPTVATDYAVGPALEHALVDLLGLDWEVVEGYEGFYADYQEFVRLVRRKRNAYQEQEVMQLHRLWQEKGGISELSADMSLEDVLRRFQGDFAHLIQGGQAMVGDLYTLPIDPALLNGGLTNYKLGRGQIMFLVALAVVTGKYDYSISRLPKTAQEAGINIKALNWKKLSIDWRRGYAILRDMGGNKNWWQQFVGLEGYREFTFLYADGDMQKGFTIASALLEMQGKRGIGEVLKWQALHIKTSQLPQIKQALDDLVTKAAQPDYDALGEYASWSNKWAGGDMLKGFMIASALLEMQGRGVIGEVLKWQGLKIKTSQLPQIKQALDDLVTKAAQPDYDALGEYASWSDTWAGGDMEKGFKIASALLEMQGSGEIGEVLKWHELRLKTSDLVFIQQARSRARPPAVISVPKELVGVITGQSFTGLQKILPISSKPMTLVQGQGPQLVSAHTSKHHARRPVVHRVSRAIHSSDIVHAAAMLIRDHLIIDQGTEGALALAPEMEVAPVAANDDVEHTLRVVGDTASVEADQLNPAPLATQPLAPQLFGLAHLANRAASHHVLRVVP